MIEIELKLRGSPVRLKGVFAHLAKEAIPGTSFKKPLRAVYYDTSKGDLRDKGLTLRVRAENGRFVQTLKQEAPYGVTLKRGEWSDDVGALAPELLGTTSGRKVRGLGKDLRLLPRFHTTISREGFSISPRRGALVELVRDQGDIRPIGKGGDRGGPVARVSEIELELKRGSPGALYDAALKILDVAPVQIEVLTKSQRGYALLETRHKSAAVRAEAPSVRGNTTLADVLRSAARSHFGQFLANAPGALEHHPVCIHQMRVAMRRLRSAVNAVRALLPDAEFQFVSARLKFLLQSLGAARDWEVLTERMSEIDARSGSDRHAESVRRAASAEKQQALAQADRALRSRASTRAVLEAMRWFEDLPTARYGSKLQQRSQRAAGAALARVFARVRHRGRRFARLSTDDRHRLRIACKILRYNVELFGALYPRRKVEKFLAQLRPVQDDLGHLNDVSRARELLGDLAKTSPQKAIVAAVIEQLEARVAAAEKRARKHVAALRRTGAFW